MSIRVSKGFTLIEAIMYLAIFSMLLTAMLSVSAMLVQSATQGNTVAMLSEEGNFLLAKISSDLTSAQLVEAPQSGQSGTTLTADTTTYSSGPQKSGLYILEGLAEPVRLNNSNTWLDNLLFYHQAASNYLPESVGVHFTLFARTESGRVLSQDFYATTTLSY